MLLDTLDGIHCDIGSGKVLHHDLAFPCLGLLHTEQPMAAASEEAAEPLSDFKKYPKTSQLSALTTLIAVKSFNIQFLCAGTDELPHFSEHSLQGEDAAWQKFGVQVSLHQRVIRVPLEFP